MSDIKAEFEKAYYANKNSLVCRDDKKLALWAARWMARRLGVDFSNNPDDPANHCMEMEKELEQ